MTDDFRKKEEAEREARKAKENAEREARKAKENAERGVRTLGPKTAELKSEAREYGIDTKGMSSRQIKGAISQAKSIEDDMLKFIEKYIDKLNSRKLNSDSSSSSATITRTTSEDRKSSLIPNATNTRRQPILREIPPPPTEGVYVLGSKNGEIKWLATDQCQ